MNILIDINHPAHIHVFKNFAELMEKNHHKVLFTTIDKEITVDLLKKLNKQFFILGKNRKGLFFKIIQMIIYDIKLLIIASKYKVDLFISHGSVYASFISFLLRKPHIAFEDTEHAKLNNFISHLFSKVILTPRAYRLNLGKKHLRYDGNLELAYLHPRYFRADINIREKLNLSESEQYAIVRFVSWNATHDINIKSMSITEKEDIVRLLSSKIKVFISSEERMDSEFENLKLNIDPSLFLDVLANASLYLGEGGTIASESAVLGIPNIYINPLEIGYYSEEVEKYSLGYHYKNDIEELKNKILTYLLPKTKDEFEDSRRKFISEKIDVTAFMVWFVENYPRSHTIMNKNPDFQYNFK